MFTDINTAVYSDYFGVENIPQEVLNKMKDESITDNIFRIQDNKSVMRVFYCIAFIEYRNVVRIYQFIFSKWL